MLRLHFLLNGLPKELFALLFAGFASFVAAVRQSSEGQGESYQHAVCISIMVARAVYTHTPFRKLANEERPGASGVP